ncbi:MAG: hypothetical protein HFI50_09175 [Lachnospiraceae bacterium]|jgi:CDP-glycerol glycerophosphotransferase|nr:hypothetical protein [Lachnospiraceae bacterium]
MKEISVLAYLNLTQKLEETTPDMRNRSWRNFYTVSRKRSVYLVGCGKKTGEFLEKFGKKYRIAGVLDNDKRKHGKSLQELYRCGNNTRIAELKVSFPGELTSKEYENGIFLITPVCGYGILEKQLRAYGGRNIYSYFLMESKTIRCRMQVFIGKKGVYEWFKVCEFYRNRKYRVNKRKIVFSAFGTYCDHGKYITEELLRQKKKYEIVWAISDSSVKVPQGIRTVMRGDLEKYIYEMATAGIWIFNSPVEAFVRKRKGQIYIQTKHWTGITLKKFYLDAATVTKNKERVKLWKKNAKMMDYIITASDFDSQSCLRGFCPKGKCVELGSARTDILFDEQKYRFKVREMLNLPQDAKILLYAPTYRFKWSGLSYEQKLPEYGIDYKSLIEELEKKFHGQWYILLRFHPGLRKYSEQVCLTDRVINVSLYPDGEEFVAASDILVSDYSSIMFEPAYVKKPVFLYATDIDEYLENDYDLLLDIRSLPFSLAENNEELIGAIRAFDQEEYQKRLDQFLSGYRLREDGNSCQRIVEFIDSLVSKSRDAGI